MGSFCRSDDCAGAIERNKKITDTCKVSVIYNLATETGFEPATSRSTVLYANQLRHSAIFFLGRVLNDGTNITEKVC